MAFHPYPQVIPSVFNRSGFGPPRGLTPVSACPWVDHPASRLRGATERPVQTRLRCGSLPSLTSQRRATRWLILQKARRHTRAGAPTACRRTGSGSLSLPCSGCFSPFPHGTRSLSVMGECLALEGGPPGFPPRSTCAAVLGIPQAGPRAFRVRGCHPVPPPFPGRSATQRLCNLPGAAGLSGMRSRDTGRGSAPAL